MPRDFKVMDGQMLERKYPLTNKPSEVYTNDEGNVNIAFIKTAQKLMKQEVFSQGQKIEKQIRASKGIQLLNKEQLKVNNLPVYVFDFFSKAFDTQVYNRMFIFSLRGQMVVGSFNCIIALQSQWQEKANQIIRSIKEI